MTLSIHTNQHHSTDRGEGVQAVEDQLDLLEGAGLCQVAEEGHRQPALVALDEEVAAGHLCWHVNLVGGGSK